MLLEDLEKYQGKKKHKMEKPARNEGEDEL